MSNKTNKTNKTNKELIFREDKGKGYMYCYAPDHYCANGAGKVMEHVYVMAEHIGRPLEKGEVVHHKDRNKKNNNIDNLQLMSVVEHSKLHANETNELNIPIICMECNEEFHGNRYTKFCSGECIRVSRNRKTREKRKDLKKSSNGPDDQKSIVSLAYQVCEIISEVDKRFSFNCAQCGDNFTSDSRAAKFCSNKCNAISSRKFEISKEELTELVWEYPTSTLAKMFGVSDVAIGKRCKKMGIKKPPVGYWAKKSSGNLVDTLFEFVKNSTTVDNECWIWNMSINSDGNPSKKINGKEKSVPRALSEELKIIESGDNSNVITKTCGNKLCCNPDHFEVKKRGYKL